MNEIFQTAAEILLDLCGEDALLRSGSSVKHVRAVPCGAVKQSADSSGNAAGKTRSFLLELNSANSFFPQKSRLVFWNAEYLVLSASLLPEGKICEAETEVLE